MSTQKLVSRAVLAVAGASLLGLGSCQRADVVEPSSPVMSQQDVVNRDGILVFKDRKTMKAYNSFLNAKGSEYAKQWEASKNFKSMARIFSEVQEAEDQLEKTLIAGKSTQELAAMRQQAAPHTAEYRRWVEAGTLRVVREEDGAEQLSVNAAHSLFTNVLNAEGIVAYGDTVCQFKGGQVKYTTDGLKNLSALRSATVSDKSQHIVVKNFGFPRLVPTGKQGSGTTAQRIEEDASYRSPYATYSSNGTSRRLSVTARLYSDLYEIDGTTYKTNYVDFWYEGLAEYKNTWGNWKLQENGKGFSSFDANYGWNAIVTRYWYEGSSMGIPVPGYTSGSKNLTHTWDVAPNKARFDSSTGSAQFGNLTEPNGEYNYNYFAYYFSDPALRQSYNIYQGIKLNSGSTFTAHEYQGRADATLTWP